MSERAARRRAARAGNLDPGLVAAEKALDNLEHRLANPFAPRLSRAQRRALAAAARVRDTKPAPKPRRKR